MIKIEIEKGIKHNTNSMFISFDYNSDILTIIRSQPIRYWLPVIKKWEIPLYNKDKLINDLNNYEVSIIDNTLNDTIQTLPNWYTPKTKPLKHQIDGVNFGLDNNKFVLADEQGLGKTWQVINIAVIKKKLYNYKHCLIVCGVNGLKYNWEEEIKKHSDENSHILGTRRRKNGKICIGGNREKLDDLINLPDKYFIIVNIEIFRDKDIALMIKNLCDKGLISMIAFDEAHKCKNPNSQQTKGLLKCKAETMIPMTGTPLMNNPLDLYVALKWLDFEKHSFYQFRNHYCILGGYGNYQIMSYKNLDQLKDQFNHIMLRRLKKDVLDLPEKIYSIDYVEMNTKQSKIYEEILLEFKNNIDLIKLSPNPLTKTMRLRQATGHTSLLSSTINESAKFERLKELVFDIINNDNKVIIFSNWTKVIDIAKNELKEYNPAFIVGSSTIQERKTQENIFMTDNNCRVILGTIGAMGTGLTLTSGTTVIFLDEPWTRADKDQAIDRCHRIGTKEKINIITLVCKNTIDEKIYQLVQDKGNLSDNLIDNIKNNINDKIDFLIS